VVRPATGLFALVSSTLVAFGWVADRALGSGIRYHRARERPGLDAGRPVPEGVSEAL